MTALLARGEGHARELIAGLLKECREGVSDREPEALVVAKPWGLDESWVKENFAVARSLARAKGITARLDAADAKATPVKRRKVGDDRQRALEARGRNIVAELNAAIAERKAAEVEIAEAEAIVAQRPQLEALAARPAKAKPKPKAEPEPAPAVVPVPAATQPPQDELLVLSRAAPMDSAKRFAKLKLFQGGALATYHHRDKWWQWNGRFYETAPDARISDWVYHFLDGARAADGESRFKPKPQDAEALIKCLKACVGIDANDMPPRWLDERPTSAENLLVFGNCLVDCETGSTAELTPQLWVQSGVDFDYDPLAQCPRWEQFLREVFPGDAESQMTIEEQLGYGMTNDTRFEKGALWIGVKRSGKTTIAWIQERLVGAGAYASLSFHNWVRGENSHANIIGKKVGVFSDVRLKPGKSFGATSYDPGGIDHLSAELLLNIIGRDTVSVGQKYRDAWQGRLAMKVIITSNEVPNLQDAGGVLASRFIKLEFKESFWGREDVNLRDQLEAELPGIANRCLAAYRRLRRRGRFLQPQGGLELERKIEEKINHFAAFMSECFVEDIGGPGVSVFNFYEAFLAWCRENRRHDLIGSVPRQKLIQHVNGIQRWGSLKSAKAHGQPRRYPGIKPRPKAYE